MTEQLTPEPEAAPRPELAPAPAVLPPLLSQAPPLPAPPRPPRGALRAVARWTAAVLVCGVLGTGTAFGIARLDRTDVPGLATADDGRWDYPELSLPALPAGSPRPFSYANKAETHHADLRELLLPAPAGATADKKLAGGWVSVDQYVSAYAVEQRPRLKEALRHDGVRHVAARGWTMPDGTVSRVYLLQFESVAFTAEFVQDGIGYVISAGVPLAAAPEAVLDEQWSKTTQVRGTRTAAYTEPKPYGATQVRQGYIRAGDTLALVVNEKKGGAAAVPFHQTMILQTQLLG
ncbi:hypothetical protein QR77_21630 [Streptomyces sp. 150FB]|uniref:hypothetical protein n=1 Tax=Streptomyces sp. 150FB TaxID=1576605 RepID=UPI000588F070|nr:hypothetical protein [Streptomyces sp. 150FB]KIF75786.1 hypothetical protein QR77_21630 [Streptomyces sp. 150FB]